MASNETWIFQQGGDNLIIRLDYDVSGNVIYQAWAQAGSASSASVWRIKKLNYNGSNQLTDTGFPGGSPAFKYVWDNRATAYTYS